ncbi:chitin-binding lectin 1-like [Ostrinia furnacalis]|uniref:chitin-binding lectin 1-like n=1 Tax=Ostrinia furnacalis TaxID=93504 RepID=UPI00103D3ECB|nr:chitin-binding lectin 1-like [Ostrinia furnacalis]
MKLVQQDCSSQTHVSARPPQPVTTTYPVQPVVRDSASAMAKLCRQLPAPTPVYPAASSPDPARAHHAPPSLPPRPPPPPPVPTAPPAPGKTPAPPAAVIPRIEVDMVDAR